MSTTTMLPTTRLRPAQPNAGATQIPLAVLTPPAKTAGLYKGLKQLSELISLYQSLKDTGLWSQTETSIISTAKQCNLDKDVKLPDEGEEIPPREQDLVVGKVYSKVMEIESGLLPCGLHVIGEPPSAMKAVATLVNIAALDRPEYGISSPSNTSRDYRKRNRCLQRE